MGDLLVKPIRASISLTPAPDTSATVASFRTWRGSQGIAAERPIPALMSLVFLRRERDYSLLQSRRERDSNPRYAMNVYTLSRRAPSTARTSLQSQRVRLN